MKSMTEKIQSWLAAVAFAEAGEHETAMEIAGITPRPAKSPSSALNAFDRTFVGVSFAEEGLYDEARRYLKLSDRSRPVEPEDFLESIGLRGVRVQYVVARL